MIVVERIEIGRNGRQRETGEQKIDVDAVVNELENRYICVGHGHNFSGARIVFDAFVKVAEKLGAIDVSRSDKKRVDIG